MKGVSFGGLRSDTDLGLLLYSKKISPPKARTITVEVPGRDGSLDITEALTGRVMYEDREISFVFRVPNPKEQWVEVYSDVLNMVHGQRMDIILDDDPDNIYTGRVSVDNFSTNRNLAEIGVKCIVAPKKSNKNSFSKTYAISDSKTVTIQNNGIAVVPTITAEKEMEVTFDGTIYHLSPGKNRIFDILFPKGSSKITFIGNGNVTVEFKVQSL